MRRRALRYNAPLPHRARSANVNYYHQHNLVEPQKAGAEKKYGIRVTLPQGDTFQRLLGDGWEKNHWYPSEAERDRAYANMAERHGYYRKTDTPTQVLQKIMR
jgi:hypothetical protein